MRSTRCQCCRSSFRVKGFVSRPSPLTGTGELQFIQPFTVPCLAVKLVGNWLKGITYSLWIRKGESIAYRVDWHRYSATEAEDLEEAEGRSAGYYSDYGTISLYDGGTLLDKCQVVIYGGDAYRPLYVCLWCYNAADTYQTLSAGVSTTPAARAKIDRITGQYAVSLGGTAGDEADPSIDSVEIRKKEFDADADQEDQTLYPCQYCTWACGKCARDIIPRCTRLTCSVIAPGTGVSIGDYMAGPGRANGTWKLRATGGCTWYGGCPDGGDAIWFATLIVDGGHYKMRVRFGVTDDPGAPEWIADLGETVPDCTALNLSPGDFTYNGGDDTSGDWANSEISLESLATLDPAECENATDDLTPDCARVTFTGVAGGSEGVSIGGCVCLNRTFKAPWHRGTDPLDACMPYDDVTVFVVCNTFYVELQSNHLGVQPELWAKGIDRATFDPNSFSLSDFTLITTGGTVCDLSNVSVTVQSETDCTHEPINHPCFCDECGALDELAMNVVNSVIMPDGDYLLHKVAGTNAIYEIVVGDDVITVGLGCVCAHASGSLQIAKNGINIYNCDDVFTNPLDCNNFSFQCVQFGTTIFTFSNA